MSLPQRGGRSQTLGMAPGKVSSGNVRTADGRTVRTAAPAPRAPAPRPTGEPAGEDIDDFLASVGADDDGPPSDCGGIAEPARGSAAHPDAAMHAEGASREQMETFLDDLLH